MRYPPSDLGRSLSNVGIFVGFESFVLTARGGMSTYTSSCDLSFQCFEHAFVVILLRSNFCGNQSFINVFSYEGQFCQKAVLQHAA